MKTREQRLKAIQHEIVPSRIQDIADKALEPEFKPEIGKLYVFSDDDDDDCWYGVLKRISIGNVYPYYSNINQLSRCCRPITKEEWVELGAPVPQPMTPQQLVDSVEGESETRLQLIMLAQEATDLLSSYYENIPRSAIALNTDFLVELHELGKKIKEYKDEDK